MSDDGTTAIVVIALLGSPFSPGYARARARGPSRALDHCSMNVALYGRAISAFALQERSVDDPRSGEGVAIGSSCMRWERDALVIDVDEQATPFARPIRGRVVVRPEVCTGLELDIDERGAHRWWPVAPLARIDVHMSEPGLRFRGHGYHDANAGDIPLESTFDAWTWTRARARDGALMTYDVQETTGAARSLGFRVAMSGGVEPIASSWSAPLPRSFWRVDRSVQAEGYRAARIVRELEDGPFYARSLVETRMGGHDVVAMHETLAAHRLRKRWVRFLTGFRIRRAA